MLGRGVVEEEEVWKGPGDIVFDNPAEKVDGFLVQVLECIIVEEILRFRMMDEYFVQPEQEVGGYGRIDVVHVHWDFRSAVAEYPAFVYVLHPRGEKRRLLNGVFLQVGSQPVVGARIDDVFRGVGRKRSVGVFDEQPGERWIVVDGFSPGLCRFGKPGFLFQQ